MDYNDISRILAQKSLAADPAFDAIHFLIEDIPCFNGCPLGLYYPDTATIIIPPDSTEAALLHELGHRHGHYYYGDLSETYAEDFRKIYQPKGRALLYSGNHIENLPKFGALFQEGERGAVEIALAYPLTMDELYDFKSLVLSHQEYSEKAPRFYYGGDDNPWVRIEFTKGVDWMVIIGSVLSGLVVAGIGTIGYAVYKISAELPWAIPLGIASFFGFIMVRSMARRVERAGIAEEVEKRVRREIAAGG